MTRCAAVSLKACSGRRRAPVARVCLCARERQTPLWLLNMSSLFIYGLFPTAALKRSPVTSERPPPRGDKEGVKLIRVRATWFTDAGRWKTVSLSVHFLEGWASWRVRGHFREHEHLVFVFDEAPESVRVRPVLFSAALMFLSGHQLSACVSGEVAPVWKKQTCLPA